ncbi:MAG TPA: M24 family metallopeptidase [bacterium]|nr:M24 family metallopeptidase [bacterium]
MKSSNHHAQIGPDWQKVRQVIDSAPSINRDLQVPLSEFKRRQKQVAKALAAQGIDVGVVFSDEHYCGDVPYLGGNINVSIEQVAGAIGKNGFHILAGLEGGYVAEQLAPRAGATVHKVELLQLADEKYPIRAERLPDVLDQAAGKKVETVALLTPRQVIPAALVEYLQKIYGKRNVVDAQPIYFKIKYEKSVAEIRLVLEAAKIADTMMRAMLAVLRPGLYETEVAAWAELVAKLMGAEDLGFKTMVGANSANRTLIGPALNRPIREGDWVHLGVAPKRGGLNACVRRSVIAVSSPKKVTADQRFWFDLVEGAYQVGLARFIEVAKKGLPARLQEQALVDYFAGKSNEVSRRIGKKVRLETLKPYTGTHNSGYTECQEFYGAITLDSDQPLGRNIIMMLDVALRGFGDRSTDVIIPGFDYLVIEDTLAKQGKKVEVMDQLPVNVQHLVGRV